MINKAAPAEASVGNASHPTRKKEQEREYQAP
jgi:hypothetical protein